MKIKLAYIILLFSYSSSFSQIRKAPQAYAIIIGINGYKSLPKLLFAKNDALSFYNLLLSPSFNLKKENIYLLIDEEATYKNCIDALYKFSDSINENDILYFYFSGHGDIESKLSLNNPLLLLTNSPSTSYFRDREFLEINFLRDYFIKLNSRNVKSYFICDACHSGSNLIGGLDGIKKTNEGLSTSWTNEIRLLSCQSNELSQESNKWGNGRGVFSFYLELALKGLSDNNKDGEITLGELKRYLESQVARNTNERQNPSISGDPKKYVCNVNTNALVSAQQMEKGIEYDNTMVTISRGPANENDLILDEFLKELKIENEFQFINPEILNKAKQIQSNYFLQNRVETELFEYSSRKINYLIQVYYDNEREENLMPQRDYFIELSNFLSECIPYIRNKYYKKELELYSLFLGIEYNTIGVRFLSHAVANNFINKLMEYKKEGEGHPFVFKKLCELYLSINENYLAEQEANKYVLSLPNDPFAHNYLGIINFRLKKYQNAVKYFQNAIEIKPLFYNAYYNLGITYQALNLPQEARYYFRKAEEFHQPNSN